MGDSKALDLREKPQYEAPQIHELEESSIEQLGADIEAFLQETVQA